MTTEPAPTTGHDFAAARATSLAHHRAAYVRALADLEECLPDATETTALVGQTPHALLHALVSEVCSLLAESQAPLWGPDYIAPQHVVAELSNPDNPGELRASTELGWPRH